LPAVVLGDSSTWDNSSIDKRTLVSAKANAA